MQDREYFTRQEAEAKIGFMVEALAPFPSVPKGTIGEVVKAHQFTGEHFTVEVKWDLPQHGDLVDLTAAAVSFNLLKKRKPITDEFCKSEFAELVKVVERAEDE